MNILLLTLLAIQVGLATETGLNLWPQVAAVPPGTNSTSVNQTVTQPPGTNAQVPTPSTVVAPGAMVVLPAGAGATGVAPSGPAAPSTGITAPAAQPGIPSPAPGSQASPAGASAVLSGSVASGTALPVGSAAPAQDGNAPLSTAIAPQPSDTNVAVTPSRVLIAVRHGRKPPVRRMSLWTEGATEVLTVAPLQPWLKATAVRQNQKGARVYDISVDPAALPAGTRFDGTIRVGSSTGTLDIPVTVELEIAR